MNLTSRFPFILGTVLFSFFHLLFSVNVHASDSPNALLDTIKQVEADLKGKVGVAVLDVSTQDTSHYNGHSRFPMMSTFKILACAKLLADIDNKSQSFDTAVIIDGASLITYSPITENHINQTFTLEQACTATMETSDNTAANIVLSAIGGPKTLTQFMQSIGDHTTRLDRIEPELNQALVGDPRDTTTPIAMVNSLDTLLFGTVLTDSSKQQLKQWMTDNKVAGSLLRSVLPDGWVIADRSGAGGHGSRGITAIIWPNNGSPKIISIYITQSTATMEERNQAIATIGKTIFSEIQNQVPLDSH